MTLDWDVTLRNVFRANKNKLQKEKSKAANEPPDFLSDLLCFLHATRRFAYFTVWMSTPVNRPVLWTLSQVVTGDKSYRLNRSGSKRLSLYRGVNATYSTQGKMPGKCLTSKWVDMCRRWSDNQMDHHISAYIGGKQIHFQRSISGDMN